MFIGNKERFFEVLFYFKSSYIKIHSLKELSNFQEKD